jgi:broad-specificity NMP kinase
MQPLTHVLWIGGPAGSGKTTVAKRIARRHGLRWYNADKHTWEHRDRAIAEGNAAAIRWEAMTPEDRWVTFSPAEIVELCLDFEPWPMIADDLRRLPALPPIVAEGSTVLPELVTSGVADPTRAVWLIPTPELLRARNEKRGIHENVVEYRLFVAAEIERRARQHGVTTVSVDGSQTVAETVAAIEELFAEALVAGPRAESAPERRALLRYANETVVSQCLAYLARPWTTGDAESFVREFVCECDDVECDAIVELAVAAFARRADAGPVVAEGHVAR